MSDRTGGSAGLIRPGTVEEVRDAITEHPRVLALGGGTKWNRAETSDPLRAISTSALSGVVEYQPDEYTITARAGTPLAEIDSVLKARGQALPFDPPFASSGSTFGGMVASGLSGSGSQRHGRMRDFILAVQFVTGDGTIARAGARVVKNSAGFDLPKLMVGSLGRFGILTEITFKVFPRSIATRHLRIDCESIDDAVAQLIRLNRSQLVLDAIDLAPPGSLHITLAGQSGALEPREARLQAFVDRPIDPGEPGFLRRRLEGSGGEPADRPRIKIALRPSAIGSLNHELNAAGAKVIYTFGGATGWISFPGDIEDVATILSRHEVTGMVFRSPRPPFLIGRSPGSGLIQRLRRALDPDSRFPEFQS